MLTVIAGQDPNDPTTVAEISPTDYTAELAPRCAFGQADRLLHEDRRADRRIDERG